MRTAIAIAGALFGALGCAHGAMTQKIDEGTYHITCPELPLGRCLSETVNNACDGRGYFVVRGISDVNRRGHAEAPDLATSSEAIVRCATGESWGGEAKQLMEDPSAAPAAAPAAPKSAVSTPPTPAPAPVATATKAAPPACTPGSTQSCVGAGACAGGQACKADGSGYEPCDCGSPEAPR
jgi:hypothetical protein